MFELPQFNEVNFNGIKLEQVLLERVCCSGLEDSINIDRPMDIEISEWLYIVRVCLGEGKKYLYLDINNKSVEAEHLWYNGKYPQKRIIALTDSEADRIINELSEFGKEYCENNISEFQDIMNRLLEIIPCEVLIYPFSSNGFYDKSHNSIHIANNKTQYTILSSIIHEYTHYILDQVSAVSSRDQGRTWKEYYLDENENICNAVAYITLSILIPEYIGGLENELQYALDEYKRCQQNCKNMHIDTDIYMSQCLSARSENDETVISVVNSILEKYRNISNNEAFKNRNIAQSELFVLPVEENNKLLEWINEKFE